MKLFNGTLAILIGSQIMMGCAPPSNNPNDSPDNIVVRSKATFELNTGRATTSLQDRLFQFFLLPKAIASTANSTVAVTVTNAAASSMTLNTSLFNSSPTISNTVIDFGYLQIGTLADNNLDVCGSNSNQHCGTAIIRIYTTGTAQAGLYNSVDDFGAPITAGQSTLSTVGLTSSNALTLQSISIPNTKHVTKLSDFTNPKYDFQVDFTNAGAGSYTTTVVIEYALSP